MVKSLAGDLRTKGSSEKDNSFNNSIHHVCTNHLSKSVTIRGHAKNLPDDASSMKCRKIQLEDSCRPLSWYLQESDKRSSSSTEGGGKKMGSKKNSEDTKEENRMSNCNNYPDPCYERVCYPRRRRSRFPALIQRDCSSCFGCPLPKCSDNTEIVPWQPPGSCNYNRQPCNPPGRFRCSDVWPQTICEDNTGTYICRSGMNAPCYRSQPDCCRIQCQNGRVKYCCRKPNSTYVCEKYGPVHNDPDDKTFVYVCDKENKVCYDSSPDRCLDPEYVIGTNEDIRLSPEQCSQYQICQPDPNSDCNYENMSDQDTCYEDISCEPTCKYIEKCSGASDSALESTMKYILLSFGCTLRTILLTAMVIISLMSVLVFITFNTLAHYFILTTIILQLFILMVRPNDLLVYNYLP